jgi:hypothetical protein
MVMKFGHMIKQINNINEGMNGTIISKISLCRTSLYKTSIHYTIGHDTYFNIYSLDG